MNTPLPVFRPQLPDADRLLPYLRRIDAARIYTNWGPLATEFERRLASHFRVPEQAVVSASSGTAALVGAVLATAGRATRARPLAILPAFTFVATAIAAEQCGYRPYIVDVDGENWRLDIDRLEDHEHIADVGLVIAVAPFGRPVPQERCLSFRQRTAVPVVIDGGASFEAIGADPSQYVGAIPTALSFHATKTFSSGEGGCVITTDPALATRVAEALNFGFHGSRNSVSASTNGKMSEYHAAVGLAELDRWPGKSHALRAVADRYRDRLGAIGLASRFIGAPSVAGCYALLSAADAVESHRMEQSLMRSAIESRFWYGGGLLAQKHFHELPHDSLDVTERLASRTIGLPTAADLPDEAIDRVVGALR